LEIFKTFDLNPISLNHKFAKPISIFRWHPKSHFGLISMAANPTPLPFPEISPPAIRPKRPDTLLSWPFGPTQPAPSSPSFGRSRRR
jgi:hypothetical protein